MGLINLKITSFEAMLLADADTAGLAGMLADARMLRHADMPAAASALEDICKQIVTVLEQLKADTRACGGKTNAVDP